MRDQCIREVVNAAGRTLTQQEIQGIDDRIYRNMRQLAQQDPAAWQGMSENTRLTNAAEAAAQELIHEAQLKKRRVALTIAAHDRINNYISNYTGKDGKLGALDRTLAFHADTKSNFQSVETRAKATRDFALGRMQQTFDAVDPRIFGLFEDAQGVHDLVFEMWGINTGNQSAKNGAKAWLKTAELLRARFNDAGGDVGSLDNWSLPQHHSQMKVSKAGKQQWTADIIGKLDRSRYINEDGTPMSDSQLTEFLNEAYQTISTNGLNKIDSGGFKASGSRANRGNKSRQIHFNDPQSYLDYQAKYGEKDLWGVMVGHVDGISKDIALVETFGPNPDHVFKSFIDDAKAEAINNDPNKMGKYNNQSIKTEAMYNFVSGKQLPVSNQIIAKGFDTIRNLMVASKLGSALITSLTDQGTLAASAVINKLPMTQLYRNLLSSMNPANQTELRMARRAGLATETLIGSLNRWNAENLGPTWSNKMASLVIRASGLSAFSDAQKRAYGVTMMSSIGQIVNDHSSLSALDKIDNRILLSKGITETDFQIWKLAQQEDWGNGNTTMLTPESVMRIPDERLIDLGNPERIRFEAARKLLGAVTEEIDMAVITPGARDRMMAMANVQRGTWKGELTKSFFLFKSFPIAMLSRHWARGFSSPTVGGKATYMASMVVATTILGAMATQANDIVSGKKTRDMNNGKFWLAAMLKGGALGLYGDFLFSDETQAGRGITASLLGPVFSMGEEFIGLTQGNILKKSLNKETNLGADLIKFVKGVTPGANLWYTKAATDHLIFNQFQELASPGYLRKMEKRAKTTYGQSYWWRPEDPLPK